MQWFNSSASYGLMAIVLHWLLALLLIALFVLGWWMVDLDYYSQWYQLAPGWHKSLGLVAAALMLFRYVWRLINITPQPEPSIAKWEYKIALCGQLFFYALVMLIALSGYLVVTAKGEGVAVFDWFTLPALSYRVETQEDVAGLMHEILAWLLMALVCVHSLAALRHHVVNKDKTLLKIFGRN